MIGLRDVPILSISAVPAYFCGIGKILSILFYARGQTTVPGCAQTTDNPNQTTVWRLGTTSVTYFRTKDPLKEKDLFS